MRQVFIILVFLFKPFQSNAEITISFCYEEWAPYAYTKHSEHTGIIIEKLVIALKSQAINSEFFEYPFSRCNLEVNKGNVDFALFVDSDENIKIIEQKLVDWQVAIISTNRALTKQDFWDASGAGVIISNDYEYPDEINRLFERNKTRLLPISYFFTSEHELKAFFNLITKKHAAFMLVDRVWSQKLIEKYDLPIFVSNWNLITVSQHIGYSSHTSINKVNLLKSVITSQFNIK